MIESSQSSAPVFMTCIKTERSITTTEINTLLLPRCLVSKISYSLYMCTYMCTHFAIALFTSLVPDFVGSRLVATPTMTG